MGCEQIQARLSAYMDGEVAPGEAAAIRGHVAGCAECAAALEGLRTVSLGVKDMRGPVMTATMLSRLHEGVDGVIRRSPFKVEWLVGGLTAAAACLAIVFGMQLVRTPDASAAVAPERWELAPVTGAVADESTSSEAQDLTAQWMVASLSPTQGGGQQ